MSIYKSNFPHGIMFHHFHGEGSVVHPSGEGSLSADDLANMIEFLGGKRFILDVEKWLNKALTGKLENKDIFLSFDDSLLCQIEIAEPVLDSFNIKGAFFVYSYVLEGNMSRLELYRIFRNKYFSRFSDFFNTFLNYKSKFSDKIKKAIKYFPEEYLIEHKCYSKEDRIFRYIRDMCLEKKEYEYIMDGLVDEYGGLEKLGVNRWMNDNDLINLKKKGHIIGLHSHSHPNKLEILSYNEQKSEYLKNKRHIEKVVGKQNFLIAAHPSNSYNNKTLSILDSLGVDLAFCSSMVGGVKGKFKYPREDHVNILKSMSES